MTDRGRRRENQTLVAFRHCDAYRMVSAATREEAITTGGRGQVWAKPKPWKNTRVSRSALSVSAQGPERGE